MEKTLLSSHFVQSAAFPYVSSLIMSGISSLRLKLVKEDYQKHSKYVIDKKMEKALLSSHIVQSAAFHM